MVITNKDKTNLYDFCDFFNKFFIKHKVFQNNETMVKILIVDNKRANRKALVDLLDHEKYTVIACDSAEEGKRFLAKGRYELIIYNADMPELDGFSFVNYLKNKLIESQVILMGEKVDIDNLVKCVKEGVSDFVQLPFEFIKMLIAVRNALAKVKLENDNTKLHNRIIDGIPKITGNTPQILTIQKMIDKVAPCDSRVLITGANGTGKELVAKWLHEKSRRREGPLVEVNCAAIHNELIESALFGHEKGSFTNAFERRIGHFEMANGGTLFLDEIGDMSLSAQAKVLRALQEHKICRVGGAKEIDVDVRVLAATNKNLRDEIAKGNFREDLFHRLNVIRIHVPSLNERRDDIPELIEQYNALYNKRNGKLPTEITAEAMEMLKNKDWTGNVRELQNAVERLIILSEGTITVDDVEQHCMHD